MLYYTTDSCTCITRRWRWWWWWIFITIMTIDVCLIIINTDNDATAIRTLVEVEVYRTRSCSSDDNASIGIVVLITRSSSSDDNASIRIVVDDAGTVAFQWFISITIQNVYIQSITILVTASYHYSLRFRSSIRIVSDEYYINASESVRF